MTGPVQHVVTLLEEALALLDSGNADACSPLTPGFCRQGIYLGGEVPWDSCETPCSGEQNGMLYAKLVSINPKNTGSDNTNCRMYDWTAEIGVLRCIASVTKSGPPSMDKIEADAAQQARDADAIFNTLRCCDARSEALRDVTVDSWSPLGPEGACAGGAWLIGGVLSDCC